jgi:hypothetical protein
MADIHNEARELRERLKKASELSKKLQSEVNMTAMFLDRKMRVQASTTHGDSSHRETVMCIDEILSRVEGISSHATSASKKQQEHKWKRLQRGGSTVSTMKDLNEKLHYPEAKFVPLVHDKVGLVARQETFDNLFGEVQHIRMLNFCDILDKSNCLLRLFLFNRRSAAPIRTKLWPKCLPTKSARYLLLELHGPLGACL